MFYGFLADLLGLIHLGYVGFVVFGQVLILAGIGQRWHWVRNMRFRVIHLIMILIVALESLGELMCPLTTWEKNLRVLAGQPAGGDSFVADLLNRVMFFDSVPYNHWIFKSAYVSFAALVVMTFIIAPPRRRLQTAVPLEVDRGIFATALLGTLAFICMCTAWCVEDYKKGLDNWHEERYQRTFPQPVPPMKEDRLPVYFLAFTGIHFGGLAILCWALCPPAGRGGVAEKHDAPCERASRGLQSTLPGRKREQKKPDPQGSGLRVG